jgi:hypothetical protein
MPGRPESLPASTPWSSAAANAGTARRWSARHRFGPSCFRAHDDASTATIAYVAAIPSVTANGRYVERKGTRRSSGSNGTNRSTNRAARCRPRR